MNFFEITGFIFWMVVVAILVLVAIGKLSIRRMSKEDFDKEMKDD